MQKEQNEQGKTDLTKSDEIHERSAGPSGGDFLPPELAEKIPPEVRQKVVSLFLEARTGFDPITAKITPEHIIKAMELAKDNADKNFAFAKGSRWFQLAVFSITVAITLFLIVYLIERDKSQFLAPLLSALLGFAGGYGLGRKTK
ncbi:MAG: hypothetical protein V2A79_01340 [Planctomycetota bacterium]